MITTTIACPIVFYACDPQGSRKRNYTEAIRAVHPNYCDWSRKRKKRIKRHVIKTAYYQKNQFGNWCISTFDRHMLNKPLPKLANIFAKPTGISANGGVPMKLMRYNLQIMPDSILSP